MKPNLEESYSVKSNFQGEQRDLSVDLSSVPHLMKILTNLYSDPISAVVREYSTNALDSHIEAGNSAPIEVSLPTALRPTFIVQDYGVGMSKEDLLEIYSKYGASTKRDSNKVAGMFGLGCKSALAYTDQFSIRAVQDGLKTSAIIGRNEQGGSRISIVGDPEPVNESNGVKISIPVKDVQKFIDAAHAFFKWWDPGTVAIDGSLTSPPGDGVKIDDTFTIYDTNGYAHMSDVIVMGNVPYPITDRNRSKLLSSVLSYSKYVIARVPIGTVDPTPARDALEYNDRTNKNLDTIREQFKEVVFAYAQKDISEAENHSQALFAKWRWQSEFRNINNKLNFQYKGEEIPEYFEVDHKKVFDYTPGGGSELKNRYNFKQHGQLPVSILESHAIIKNFDKDNIDGNHDRLKLRTWALAHSISKRSFLLFDEIPGSPWTDDLTVYDWQVIKETSITNATYTAPATKRSGIQVMVPSNFPDNTLKRQDLSKMPNDIKKLLISPAATVEPYEIARLFSDCAVVILGRNRWDKFKREYEDVVEASAAVMERITAIENMLDDDAFLRAAQFPPFNTRFSGFDIEQVNDPKLKHWLKLQEAESETPADAKQALDDLRHLTLVYKKCDLNEKEARRISHRSLYSLPFAMRDSVAKLVKHVEVCYPFLKYVHGGRFGEDEYDYVNAMYAYHQSKPKVKVVETTKPKAKGRV